MCKEINSTDKKEEEDEYTKAIGQIGKWQIFVYLTTALPIKTVLPSVHLGIVFMAPKTTHRCLERENITGEIMNMTCYSDCKKYEYFSEFNRNIIKDWNLICDRAWIADFVQISCMFGVLIGGILFGFLADRYGRRITLIIAGLLETCTTFVAPFCSELWSFIFIRFILGIASGGTNTTSFVLLMEICGPKKRDLLGSLYLMPISFGYILVSIIAFYLRDWRGFGLIMAMPTLTYLAYFFCLPESPKWLISVGRLGEACDVMTNAAKWNKLPTENMMSIVENIARDSRTNRTSERQPTFLDLVTLPSLRINNMCSCLVWFTIGVTLYGVIQYFGQTSLNAFCSFGIVGLVKIPGSMLSGYISNNLGRRMASIIFFVIHGIGNATAALPDEWYYTKLITQAIGLCCGCALVSLVYVYTSELFPTVVRSMGLGASSTAYRLGNTLAPAISGLCIQAHWMPAAGFTIAAVIGLIACFFLPETKGKSLQDHIKEP